MNIKKGRLNFSRKCAQVVDLMQSQATRLLALLRVNASFLFRLKLFYKIMPHDYAVDILYAQMQKLDQVKERFSSSGHLTVYNCFIVMCTVTI